MPKRKIEPQDEVDPKPGNNPLSYLEMGVTRQRWARTGVSWWVNILVTLFLVLLCIGLDILCLGWYIGWENLPYALGWTN
jgi:hypothetical protein